MSKMSTSRLWGCYKIFIYPFAIIIGIQYAPYTCESYRLPVFNYDLLLAVLEEPSIILLLNIDITATKFHINN